MSVLGGGLQACCHLKLATGHPAFSRAVPDLLVAPPHPARRWFKSRAHAAELTAGYYNTRERNGYLPIFEMLKRHGATASFTCVEMRDCEHPLEGRCSPEGLLNQVRRGGGSGGCRQQAARLAALQRVLRA